MVPPGKFLKKGKQEKTMKSARALKMMMFGLGSIWKVGDLSRHL
jgi:hypothetical protein